MSIREAIASIEHQKLLCYAKEYFEESECFTGSPRFTGSHFESLGASENLIDEITAVDLLAVQNLSVKVPARAAIEILEEQSDDITALLTEIPNNLCLSDLSPEDFEKHLGKASHAQKLWDLLRRNGAGLERWGVGPTTASKILARKRPHLIPIEDSVVNRVIQKGRQDSWRLWRKELTADKTLITLADDVRKHVDHPDLPTLSTLRALDIVLWMHGTAHKRKKQY